ncbi:hypothetical protein V2A60_000761 [Cordyceps javanica]
MDRTLDRRKATDNDDRDSRAPEMTTPSSRSGGGGGGGACFAHGTPVALESGSTVEIQDLRSGSTVQTLAGPRLVVGLLRNYVENDVLCRLGDVLVTAWHPVSFDGVLWYFPVHLTVDPIMYTGDVYSILLEADGSPFAHTVLVAGLWAATLGHGITHLTTTGGGGGEGGEGVDDVRAHPFFGDYVLVCEKIAVLRPVNGAYQYYGVTRDQRTGLVNGFRQARAKTDGGGDQPYNSAL